MKRVATKIGFSTWELILNGRVLEKFTVKTEKNSIDDCGYKFLPYSAITIQPWFWGWDKGGISEIPFPCKRMSGTFTEVKKWLEERNYVQIHTESLYIMETFDETGKKIYTEKTRIINKS